MSKVKNWIMDMEESVHTALDSNCTTVEQVIAFVKNDSDVQLCDEVFVTEYFNECMEAV